MKPFKVLFLSLIFIFLLGFPQVTYADGDCINQAPSDAPNFYQVSMSSVSATLYFVQPASVFDGYVISYGLTQDADAYSTSFNQGSLEGAVKYTVNDLFPNTNYYFKVRATNGCAAGPWSQTLSTNKNVGSLPETGPRDIFIIMGIGAATLIFSGLISLLLSF